MKTRPLKQVLRDPLVWAFVVFTVVAIVLVIVHEPWGDEAQAWLLARDASLRDLLFVYAGYEGSPMLWHLILAPFAKLGFPYVAMHIIHASFAVAVAALILRYYPLPRFQRVLLIFGYFFLYEYNAISRSYILSVLVLCILAVFWASRLRRPMLYALSLAALMQTNTHSCVLAGFLSVLFVHDMCSAKLRPKKMIAAAFVLVLSATAVVLQTLQPDDLQTALRVWSIAPHFAYGLYLPRWFAQGLLPFIIPTRQFWLTHFSFDLAWGVLRGVVLMIAAFATLRSRRMTFFAVGSVCGLLVIFLFKNMPVTRHMGFFFLIFLFAYWVDANKTHWLSARYRKLAHAGITIVLVMHVLAGGAAVYFDVMYPFAPSREIAQFIQRRDWDSSNTVLLGYGSQAEYDFLPYVPDQFRQVYGLDVSRFHSFMVWDQLLYDNYEIPEQEVITRVNAARERFTDKRIVLIMKQPFTDPDFLAQVELLLWRPKNATIFPEPFYVYELQH